MSFKNLVPLVCATLCAATLSVGCGDDGGGDDTADAAATTDSAVATDSGSSSPDATPTPDAGPSVDAAPGALGCLGQPLPTTAPDPLTVSGQTYTIGLSGRSPIAGATVEAFTVGTASDPIASGTSAANGAYSLSAATNGAPLNAYVKAAAATYLDTYLYPPWPITSAFDDAQVIMLSSGTLGLAANLAGATQSQSNGFIAMLVVDCNNNPVAGATVEVSGTHGAIAYMSGGFPSGSATVTDVDGVAFVFDVAPGIVVVDATYMGSSLREHSINIIANTLTATMVAP